MQHVLESMHWQTQSLLTSTFLAPRDVDQLPKCLKTPGSTLKSERWFAHSADMYQCKLLMRFFETDDKSSTKRKLPGNTVASRHTNAPKRRIEKPAKSDSVPRQSTYLLLGTDYRSASKSHATARKSEDHVLRVLQSERRQDASTWDSKCRRWPF